MSTSEKVFDIALQGGPTGMLHHQDSVEASDLLTAWRKDPQNKKRSTAGDDRSPAWTWMYYMYFDMNDEFAVIPAQNLMTCLREAGTKMIMKKTTTYKSATQSLITMHDDFKLIPGYTGQPIKHEDVFALRDLPFVEQKEAALQLGIILDVRRVAVQQSKHVRIRPLFPAGWTARSRLTIHDVNLISPAVLRQILDIAGTQVGLGDWRPSAKRAPGIYGKFTATITEVK